MEIKVTRNPGKIMESQAMAIWNLKQQNKSWTTAALPVLLLLVGVLTVFLGFISYKMGESIWKLQSFSGIAFVAISLILYVSNYVKKKAYFELSQEAVARYKKQGYVTEITLTDDTIYIKDFQSYHELKWPVFKKISISKDHFFFMTDKYCNNGFVVSKNELTQNDILQLTSFIRNQQ